jgi:CRP-like cAMP-binding protein
VLYIHSDDIVELMEGCESILKNFVSILSNKILMLNKKTSILSFKTIEEKVASYILEEYKVKKQTTFNIPLSRKELAGYLNIPRPSLSRAMGVMKECGVIDYYQNTIQILDLEGLEACLFKY